MVSKGTVLASTMLALGQVHSSSMLPIAANNFPGAFREGRAKESRKEIKTLDFDGILFLKNKIHSEDNFETKKQKQTRKHFLKNSSQVASEGNQSRNVSFP